MRQGTDQGVAMRLGKWAAVAAAVGLVASMLAACSSSPTAPSEVLASSLISAETGGSVRAPNGVALDIPAGVLVSDSVASITAVGGGKYDLHIAGEWTGQVAVTIPLAAEEDAIAHQIGDTWVMEGTDFQQSTVWVSSLSIFTTIRDAAINLICKAFGKDMVACLLGKGIQAVDKQLALWIAQITGDTCAATIIATIIGGDVRGSRFLKAGEVLLRLVFDEACSTMAGESQEYIDAHIDWDGDGVPDAQQSQPEEQPAAAPAAPPADTSQPAPPTPADPAPPVSDPAPAPPPPAPAPGPARAWVTRVGDTITYSWENMPAGMWDQVTRFRCWRYTKETHPGGWATDGCGEQTGFSGFPSGSGSVSFTYGGANDSFSVEPWKYGPWLKVGESWQG